MASFTTLLTRSVPAPTPVAKPSTAPSSSQPSLETKPSAHKPASASSSALQSHFRSIFTYAAGMDAWVKKAYAEVSGHEMQYIFAQDFAIADWYDEKSVKETYQRAVEGWKDNYKAMTELAVQLSYMSYAHSQLKEQGIAGRDPFIKLYVSLFEKVTDFFYKHFKDNAHAYQHFFDWTD